MTPVTTLRRRSPTPDPASAEDAADHRRRLLDGLAASIAADGYRKTTVADIVRHARTSRRTFYEHFTGKEDCFSALLAENNAEAIREITAAVDPAAAWQTQIRQAVEAWVGHAEATKPITLSWIRDLPASGALARRSHREASEAYITAIQNLCDTDVMRASGVGPISRQQALIILGGLREVLAATVEEGGRPSDLTEVVVDAVIALVGPRG